MPVVLVGRGNNVLLRISGRKTLIAHPKHNTDRNPYLYSSRNQVNKRIFVFQWEEGKVCISQTGVCGQGPRQFT